MLIYLLRHGDAPYHSSSNERALSFRGEEEVRDVVGQHRENLSSLDLIVCSPVLRARQTLKVMTETLDSAGFGYSGELVFEDVLRSESSVTAVEEYVDSLNVEKMLLLSHQPLIGQLLDYLTDEVGLGYSMTTGTLACLDIITFGRGCGELQALTHPLHR